ncbi:MAG: N-ethylammeline chlorohydrolase [Thermoplasmatales archaeon]
MNDLIVEGKIFYNGHMTYGKYSILKDSFVPDSHKTSVRGTLLRAPVNFHTHLGDSFISEEPVGDIPAIVGPGGFKMRKLNDAGILDIKKSMKRVIEYMKNLGTYAFFDFRESGMKGIRSVPRFNGIHGFFLTRPSDKSEVMQLLDLSAGFGLSSISDYREPELEELATVAHRRGKIFAIHFSENRREDIQTLLKLKPDFIVHCIETKEEDLEMIRENGIPVILTPRSNVFHGKRPDYKKIFDAGVDVLLGTDNAFIVEPDVIEEASFLYQYQHNFSRIEPDSIISAITESPRKVMRKLGIETKDEKYIFFDEELSSYQILTRPHLYRRYIIRRSSGRINFFPMKD